jgi:hypothetical protein
MWVHRSLAAMHLHAHCSSAQQAGSYEDKLLLYARNTDMCMYVDHAALVLRAHAALSSE